MRRLHWIAIVFTLVACDHPSVARANASVPDLTSTPLSALLGGATSVKVTAPGKTVNVTDAKTIGAIEDALGRSRTPTASMPRCMPLVQLSFLDSGNREIARIGLCDAPGLAAPDRARARIDLPDHRMAGLEVADLAALGAALAQNDVNLPDRCAQAGGRCVSNAATVTCKSEPAGLCASAEICCVM